MTRESSDIFIGKEEASRRKPVSIYKIWCGDVYFHYTDGDVSFVYDGDTYDPATINRGNTSAGGSLDVSSLKIEFSLVTTPVIEYMASNPVDIAWIEISRLFRDQDPPEKYVIFVGQIKTVSFKGLSAEAEVVGFEHFLRMPIPTFRYQLTCNHRVFDTKCGLNKEDYKTTATVTVDVAGTTLTSATFGGYANDYFTRGYVVYGNEKRSITSHTGSAITLSYKMTTLTSGVTVDTYPGCDGRAETCRDKFNNIVNFLGFPFIPEENPALRV